MSKLLIQTQVFENYAWREDGTLGTGDEAYWKAKGGNEYFVPGVDECDMIDVIVDRVRDKVECANDAFVEYIIGYSVVADDYMTQFEKDQLEYDGRISYPAQVIEMEAA